MEKGDLKWAAQEVLKAALTERSHKDVEFLTTDEASEMAKVSRWTIYRWRMLKDADGGYLIRWSKLGSGKNSPVRIDKESFMAFLESKVQYANKEGGGSK